MSERLVCAAVEWCASSGARRGGQLPCTVCSSRGWISRHLVNSQRTPPSFNGIPIPFLTNSAPPPLPPYASSFLTAYVLFWSHTPFIAASTPSSDTNCVCGV